MSSMIARLDISGVAEKEARLKTLRSHLINLGNINALASQTLASVTNNGEKLILDFSAAGSKTRTKERVESIISQAQSVFDLAQEN